MQVQKSFEVFGEKVELLVTGAMSNGSMVVGVQHVAVGGGPALHVHTREDEFFTVLEGEFNLIAGEDNHRLTMGQSYFVPRGTRHTFRNTGATPGRMLVAVAPSGIDEYLEKLSAFSLPDDLDAIRQLSDDYGIHLLV